MSDWADEKARKMLAESFVEHTEECQHALWDVPRCNGGHEEMHDSLAAVLREAREQGAREERAACHAVVLESLSCTEAGGRIAARGPMSEGGGE